MAIVDELITLLGFEEKAGSKSKTERFRKAVDGIAAAAKKAAIAIGAVTSAVGIWGIAAARGADDSIKLARNLGITVEEMQELEFAAGRSGASVGAVSSLLEKAAQFGLTGAAGIEQLADSFKGLDAQTALLRGKAFGFGEQELRLLRQGGDAIRALRAEARGLGFIITTEQAEKAESFVDSIFDIKRAVGGLARKAAIDALPAMEALTDAFVDWFIQNRELIASGLTKFIEGVTMGVKNFTTAVTDVANRVKELLGPLDSWFAKLDKVEIISGVITGGLAILAFWLTLVGAKFLIMASLIGFAALAIEDLIVFFQGGQSVIGTFFDAFENKFPGLFGLFETMVEWVKDKLPAAFKRFGDAVEPILNSIKFVIQFLVSGIELLDEALQKLGFGVKGEKRLAQLQKQKSEIEESIKGAENEPARRRVLERALKQVQKRISKVREKGGIPLEIQRQIANSGGGAAAQMDGPRLATAPVSPAITAANNNSITRGDTTINIIGTGDPGGVANEVIRRGGLELNQQAGSPGIFAQVGQ